MLDKYRIESELGRGAMGIVLRATHVHLGEQVALKVLMPEMAASPESHARFLREAQAAVRLRGEHVARVSDIGVLPDGAPYMVMEYLRGTDLAGEIARRGVLPPGEAVDHVLQACEALAEAHAHGIVHRDVKPSNLFLTSRPDGTPLLKVLDFGISKTPVSGRGVLTATSTVMGTPGYMSPEQMKATRDVDGRTDIWALGIVLYECLTGRRPFDAEAFSAVVMLVATEPPPPMDPRIPRGLQSVVLRCLVKDRVGRFVSIADLAAALAPFARDQRAASIVVERTRLLLQGQQTAIEPTTAQGPPQPATTLQSSAGVRVTTRRFRHIVAGVVSMFGTIGVLSMVLWMRSGRSDEPVAVTARGDAAAVGSQPAVVPDGGEQIVATGPDVARSGSAGQATTVSAVEAAAVTTMQHSSVKHDEERAQDEKTQVVKCTEAQRLKDWHALADCATALRGLGATERADAFQAKATQEVQNALTDINVHVALRAGKLKEAQRLLGTIGRSSVYFESLSDAVTRVENGQVDEARRKAQSLASAHDCGGWKRFVQSLAASETGAPRVVAAAQAIKCVDQETSAEPASPKTPAVGRTPAGGLAQPAPAVGRAPGGGSAQPAPPRNQLCDTSNVDDMVMQAQNQFQAGSANQALQLMTTALACKQNVRMYRQAVLYACVAHDAASAKQYYAKLPVQFQTQMTGRCQQEGVTVP